MLKLHSDSRLRLPAVLTLLVGIALSAVTCLTLSNWEEERVLTEFKQSARDHIRNVRNELQDSIDALEQVQGFFEASEFSVSRTEFHAFAQPLLKHHRYIHNLAWAPLLPDSRHIERAPAHFVSPPDKTTLGLDFLSQPVYREALTKARSLAHTVATGRLPFEKHATAHRFALVAPVQGRIGTDKRQPPLPGYAISVIRADALVEKAITNLHPREINIQLIDASAAGGASAEVLYFRNATPATTPPSNTLRTFRTLPAYLAAATISETFELAGRNWTVVCTIAPNYPSDAAAMLPWVASLGVLLLSILVALIQLTLVAERRVTSRSTELAEANSLLSLGVAERRRAEEALRTHEQQLRLITDNIPAMIGYYDAEQYCRFANRRYANFYGFKGDQMLNKHLSEIQNAEAYQQTQPQIEKVLAGGVVNYERIQHTGDGKDIHLAVSLIPDFDDNQKARGAYVLIHDVTERKRMEMELFGEKERAQVTLESIGDAVITCDAKGAVTYLNPIATRLTGWSTEEARGLPLPAVFRITHEITGEAMPDPVQQCLAQGTTIGSADHTSDHDMLSRRDGAKFAIDDLTSTIRDRQGNIIGAVLVFHDVTRQRAMARQLTHQATHDALTALVNRIEFERRLGRLLAGCREDHTQHALCFLDLDGFKLVNDSCGHQAGDELLRQIGGVLQQRLRGRDTLARLGGDEFGVLLERCPPEQSLRIAEELREAVNDFHFVWQEKPFTVGVSIGVVSIADNSPTMPEILNAADTACYAAKEQGRNRVLLYQSKDDEQNKQGDHIQWLAHLNEALEQQRFRLFCQAIVPLRPGAKERQQHEVLLRLEGKDCALITPGAFLPFADRYNLTPDIDRWVVRRIISLCHVKRQENPQWPLPLLSVNVSGATLSDPTYVEFVREQLLEKDLPGNTLCFEINEATAIAQLTATTHFIQELKKLGCHFTIDGFGGSAASFTQIKHLPVDFIKISGNFVRDMHKDPVDSAIVEAASHIAHLLGIRSIAMGVENTAVLVKLRALNISFGQGYSISQPLPLEEMFGKN